MIYTKTGDKGETSLANGQRVSKADARLEAYGTADELNSWIGLLRAGLKKPTSIPSPKGKEIDGQLRWVQNKLFNLGAALSEAPGDWLREEDVQQLEKWIDDMQSIVPQQHAFILPAGGETVSRCHVCRTLCRRTERKMVELGVENTPLCFVNRLSDYLFVLSRYVAFLKGESEEKWQK